MARIRTPDMNQFVQAAQTQVRRNLTRARPARAALPARQPPPSGAPPRDVIYSRGPLRLYHYRPMTDEVYRVPVVCVMSLISKPWILDLAPGQSLIEYLLRQGFDVFMVDWGIPRPEDKNLNL